MAAGSYTTSTAFLEALAESGVRYIFANLGSDHPGLIEALAQVNAEARAGGFPQLIVCPHETVALSAAHAYASVSRQPQAVLVHVDAGTQNLGGAVSNAMRGRVPVLIFAGAAPFTITGELPAGRNEFIHWFQDVHDQRGILRGYVKYDNEIRTGGNVKQLVHRALQIARSEPSGPVYLVGPREVMEEPVEPYTVDPAQFPPAEPAALTADVIQEIAAALAGAVHPLIITSYLGRNPDAVPALVELAELLAIPVLESAAFHVNFPGDHPLHAGYQFTTSRQNQVLAGADVILVLDSDVPWIHAPAAPRRTPRSTPSTSTRSRRACRCGTFPRGASPPPTRRWRWSRSPDSLGTKFSSPPEQSRSGGSRSRRPARRGGPHSMPSSTLTPRWPA